MSNFKLKNIVEQLEQEKEKISPEMKREFVNAMKNYSALGEQIYGPANIKELAERVRGMVEFANQYAMNESDDWFDNVTVKRHMKGLTEAYKVFEKSCQEMAVIRERMTAAYEDIGQGLGKYFEVE